MDLLNQILVLTLTPTSVVAILIYVCKKFFESTIAKDLEEFKNQLKIQSLEHQIKFSFLHDKRARVYSEIYTFLVRTIDAVNDLVRPIRINESIIIEQKKKTVELFNQTNSYFRENRLFFDDDIIKGIEEIINDIKESILDFNIAQPGEEIEHGPNNDPKLWVAAYKRIKNKVKPLLEDIEKKFKKFYENT